MSIILNIYHSIFYQPIFNLLVWLYDIIPGNDIGLAIIALTIIIRLLLFPLYKQSIKSQKALQDIQPKIEELKKKYKDDKEKMSVELMNLYKEEKVNPFSSCLPLLVQLPFLIAVYQVFRSGLNSQSLEILYPFVFNPGHIDAVSFGFVNLSEPNIAIALLAGAAQFWQTRMMVKRKPPTVKGQEIKGSADEKMLSVMNKQMMYFMPVITVVIGATFPGGLALYWFVNTLLMALQQLYIFKTGNKDKNKQNSEKGDINDRKIVDVEKNAELSDPEGDKTGAEDSTSSGDEDRGNKL